jgi:hypothetical protein
MSNEEERHRGQLFDNRDKRKPSQPDMQGKGRVGGQPYAISAWIREGRLVLSFEPPRTKSNAPPTGELRGTLDRASESEDGPLWRGDVAGEDASFVVRAFQKTGKSGAYLTLELMRSGETAP